MATIDLTIVAARRPALFARTLESFRDRLFRNFTFAHVLINIDPVWGDEFDGSQCLRLIQDYFPSSQIFTPKTPNFCSAVKRVWINSKSDFIFHLEDDWLLTEPIGPTILECFSDPSIAQVSLLAQQKNWDRARRGDFHFTKRRHKLFGVIELPFRKKVAAFTTSPTFTRGNFARQWAALMNESLDPEKQTYMGINPPLEKFVSAYRNYLYPGKLAEITIIDTGREWRDAQNIQKKIVGGKSVWTQS
jgi:hypothetical protein